MSGLGAESMFERGRCEFLAVVGAAELQKGLLNKQRSEPMGDFLTSRKFAQRIILKNPFSESISQIGKQGRGWVHALTHKFNSALPMRRMLDYNKFT